MPARSPVWSACRWVRNTASKREKVESRVGEGGRQPATTVDHEHASVDHERRGDPRAAGDKHGSASRSKKHQFGCHAHLFFPAVSLLSLLRCGYAGTPAGLRTFTGHSADP